MFFNFPILFMINTYEDLLVFNGISIAASPSQHSFLITSTFVFEFFRDPSTAICILDLGKLSAAYVDSFDTTRDRTFCTSI